MRTRTLGTGGPTVGEIGLGCMGMSFAYGSPESRDDTSSVGVIRRAIDLGMTFVDTADMYGPHTNELLVGAALRDGYRDRATLATKVGLTRPTGAAPTELGASASGRNGRPDYIHASIDASLQRLGTDHVDLYQLHRVDPDVPIEESWGALAEVVAAGKALRIGLSEVDVDEIRRAHAIHPVTSVQSELSLWTRRPLDEVVPHCQENGIAFIAFAPLGRGFLTGSIAAKADLADSDYRRTLPRFQEDAISANRELVAAVQEVAAEEGATAAQVALAWVLAQGAGVIPIAGTKSATHLAENAEASDLQLGEASLARLEGLPDPVGTRY